MHRLLPDWERLTVSKGRQRKGWQDSQYKLPQLSNGHQHRGNQLVRVPYGVELVRQIDKITEVVEATPRGRVQGLNFSSHYQRGIGYKPLEDCGASGLALQRVKT